MKGSPMHRNFGIGSPAKNRITDLTGMTDKEKQNATAHNDAHAKEAASGLKHKMDDWGFAHDNKNHRGTTGAGKTAPGHGAAAKMKKDDETSMYMKKDEKTSMYMKSAFKQKDDTDERVYGVDQTKYDEWRKGKDAPDVRYLGDPKNKRHLDAYLEFKKSGGKNKKNPPQND